MTFLATAVIVGIVLTGAGRSSHSRMGYDMTPEYRIVIDLRDVLVRAADALSDAADPGGAPLTYRAVEAEVRQLIAALDQEAERQEARAPGSRAPVVKYRYVITNEGIIEADTPEEAETNAFAAMEFGSGIYVCEIEPLPGEAREK